MGKVRDTIILKKRNKLQEKKKKVEKNRNLLETVESLSDDDLIHISTSCLNIGLKLIESLKKLKRK